MAQFKKIFKALTMWLKLKIIGPDYLSILNNEIFKSRLKKLPWTK